MMGNRDPNSAGPGTLLGLQEYGLKNEQMNELHHWLKSLVHLT